MFSMSATCDSAHVESVPSHHDHPTFSPCDFFLWVYVKELVFVPPLSANIEEMKQRITAAL